MLMGLVNHCKVVYTKCILSVHFVKGAKMPVEINGETYYSTQEACTYLGVSRVTLDRYVEQGSLKKYRQGITRKVYYRLVELERLREMH